MQSNPSDKFNPVIGFDGEAYDTLYNVVAGLRGYGVTLTLEDGSEVEAVLAGLFYDEATDRTLTQFFRVVDGEYKVIENIPIDKLETAFAVRIQVA